MTTEKQASETGPLSGIKILDLTLALAGPLSTQRLADMGANVIKVEEPKRGDFTRTSPMAGIFLNGETIPYLSLNRNKRALAIDLKNTQGKEVLLELVRKADVVVQNFRPGVAERLGISYEELKAIKPDIIYLSISGYGSKGPMVKRPGQDLLVQCFSGMVGHAGAHDHGPHPSPVYLVDVTTSHLASEGILAALLQRARTGEGCHVEVSLLGAALELQLQELMTYMSTGRRPLRSKAPYASVWMEPPYGTYKVKNGYVAIAQSDLKVIAGVIQSDDLLGLAGQRPVDTLPAEMQTWRDKVYILLAEKLVVWNRDELVAALTEKEVWCGPVLDMEETIKHPQCAGMFAEMHHETAGKILGVAPNIHFSNVQNQPLRAAPKLGQHSTEILLEVGIKPEVVSQLRRDKVIL